MGFVAQERLLGTAVWDPSTRTPTSSWLSFALFTDPLGHSDARNGRKFWVLPKHFGHEGRKWVLITRALLVGSEVTWADSRIEVENLSLVLNLSRVLQAMLFRVALPGAPLRQKDPAQKPALGLQ